MDSDAVAERFLRAVVTGIDGVLPGRVSQTVARGRFLSVCVDGIWFEISFMAEMDLRVLWNEYWEPGKRFYNGRYRCRLELPLPLAANGFEPMAQHERRVMEGELQQVAGEFAGLIVAAVEASKRERGPKL